jgi:hypothetical protein
MTSVVAGRYMMDHELKEEQQKEEKRHYHLNPRFYLYSDSKWIY